MNKPIKPISSPGRTTEKFPPPLMRFLRSNVGSKSSRRRSRASPMFVRKKNTSFDTTQEPSSPKVTCIGQVRVKKHHKSIIHNHRNGNRLCRCLRNIKPCWGTWSQWVLFFRCGCFNTPSTKEQQQEHKQEEDVQHMKLDSGNINKSLILQSSPKNKLLLTRCRSVPYRPSSLANMFRETTMEKSEEEVEEKVKALKIKNEDKDGDGDEGCNESDGCEESKEVSLILSRCKSEPAKRWDQLLLV